MIKMKNERSFHDNEDSRPSSRQRRDNFRIRSNGDPLSSAMRETLSATTDKRDITSVQFLAVQFHRTYERIGGVGEESRGTSLVSVI